MRDLDGFPSGSHPWFQIWCWRLAEVVSIPENPLPAVEIGQSDVFQLDLAGPGLGQTESDAPSLRGLASFQLKLAFTGLQVSTGGENVVVRWFEDSMLPLYLQRAVSVEGPWQVLSNAVPPFVERIGSESPIFFRIVAIADRLQANRVAEGIDPSAPTPPDMRVRIRRFRSD